MKKFPLLSLVLLTACASPNNAPVELRGVGAGEMRPNASRPSYAASNSYMPMPEIPAGNAAPMSGGIQSAPLGEPTDAYAAAALNQPPPAAGAATASPYLSPPSAPISQPYQGPTTVQPVSAATTSQLGSGEFGWPLRGRLLMGFGPKGNGQANDGLNIAAPLGSPVYAAKDGVVAYAGNELKNFGNMVLLRHEGGFFTVYAHLDQTSVSKDQKISKGQPLGTVGQSGGVSEPQLHFEIRRNSTPLDPKKYLGS